MISPPCARLSTERHNRPCPAPSIPGKDQHPVRAFFREVTMPAFFAGYEIVAQTKNFLVTCEDDADARVRAQNIGYTCEADLARLNDLFSTNFEAGKTSPHGIWVVVLKHDPTSGANGSNYG